MPNNVQPDPGAPSLAVVVPATDAPPTLDRCLEAIARSTRPPDQVIVVDAPRDAGPATARNLGIRRCEAELVCFVDSDVEVHPDALARIRARFAAEPGVTAVFGAYDDSPAAPGTVSTFRNLLHHVVHRRSAGPSASFWAGLGAVRLDALRAVGGFDEALFQRPAVEDVELGARLSAAGERIELDPAILGTHLKRWSLRDVALTDAGARAAPWTRLILAGRGPRTELNLAPRGLPAVACSAAVLTALALRRPGAALSALLLLAAVELPLLRLLARRGGPGLARAGPPLRVVHHASAAAGSLIGLVQHWREPLAAAGALP